MRRLLLAATFGVAAFCALPLAAHAGAQLSASAGTYYVTQIQYGAIARVVVDSGGNVSVTDMFISGLSTEGPDSAVFAADGSLIVSNFGAGTLSRVDISTRRVSTVTINKTQIDTAADLAADPNGNDVWVIEKGLSGPLAVARVDLGSGATTSMNPDSIDSPGGITFNSDGSRVFVSSGAGTIYEVDPHSGHIVRKATVPGSPDGLTYDPSTGRLFASGCSGICELDTGTSGAPGLRLLTTLTPADGDGIAADGRGHVYVAESSCGSLCRLDIATDTSVTVADGIEGADDVTPLVGAGSGGGACLSLGSCFNGPLAAGIAATSAALVLFVGASGFGTQPMPAHQAATSTGAADHASLAGRIQEEAGEKLIEIGGAGVEPSAAAALPRPNPPPPPPPPQLQEPPPPPPPPEDVPPPPPPPAGPGMTRIRRDDRSEPDPPPPPPD